MSKLSSILLIDDNAADNRFHQLLIKGMNITDNIHVTESGLEALAFLKDEKQSLPQLIFLDLNMPKMNGWEFLVEFKKFPLEIKTGIVIIVLSTSANPKDILRSQEIAEVSNFETKPLTKEDIENIIDHYF